MITIIDSNEEHRNNDRTESLQVQKNKVTSEILSGEPGVVGQSDLKNILPEVLVISSYPPRECGIATYSQDLIHALNHKFGRSFSIKVCALETGDQQYTYPDEVKYIQNTSVASQFFQLADIINQDDRIKVVLIQHEFGLFRGQEEPFKSFLLKLSKPVVLAFHTVLPRPDNDFRDYVRSIVSASRIVIVMTHRSADVLSEDYNIQRELIRVIPHGTHLVGHLDKDNLKRKYGLKNRKVLSTFGLLSSGKGIETTLEALPKVIETHPEAIFLIIGRTHPGVIRSEGEVYREKLKSMVRDYHLEGNVKFIDKYLELPQLLEYLQLTDIYLFTSKDPNQAVSGTFAYAMSCACPIISTPIPHAKELLNEDTGIFFDFGNSEQLAGAISRLLDDEGLRNHLGINTLQNIVSTVWENSAVAHALLLEDITGKNIKLEYSLPEINFNHLNKMTTETGMIQFSKINQPDPDSGYTLDDNARALIVYCRHYKMTNDEKDLHYIDKYLNFIAFCQQSNGHFLNYIDKHNRFTIQNYTVNLDDSNGRAIWALGYLTTLKGHLPVRFVNMAEAMIDKASPHIETIHSPRAMAFSIKGLYYLHFSAKSAGHLDLLTTLANRLVQLYKHESDLDWEWFESSLTYANSILPEAILYAWLLTRKTIYRVIARLSFDFLLSKTFNENGIEVISNKTWQRRGEQSGKSGQQPIDVGYTIQTLSAFYDAFHDDAYYKKMREAFNWFLGKNRLHQIIYNPCTGGCYDGLEEMHVNLNQGAESSLSYMLARLTLEKYIQMAGVQKGIIEVKDGKTSPLDGEIHLKEPKYHWINQSVINENYNRGRI